MNNNLQLNIDHSQSKRMEAFLKDIEEPLSIVPFDWKDFKSIENIEAATKLISKSSKPLTITIFFCTSYHDANQVAKANNFPYTPNAKWSLNGSLLYIVESEDAEKVMTVLGIFAGKE